MADFPSSAYDRPNMALGRLLQGDLRGAGNALVNPDKLSPEHRGGLRAQISEWLGPMAERNPFIRGIMSVVTDPLIVATLLLQARWPVASMQKMFKYGKKFAGYATKLGPIEGLFARAERIFAGTNIPKLMQWHAQNIERTMSKYTDDLGDALDVFKKQVGRYPDYDEHLQLVAKATGLDKPGWFSITTMQGRKLKVAEPVLSDPVVLSRPLQRFYDRIVSGKNSMLRRMYREVVKPLRKSPEGIQALEAWSRKNGIDLADLRTMTEDNVGKVFFPRTLRMTPAMSSEYAAWRLDKAKYAMKEIRRMQGADTPMGPASSQLPNLGITLPALDQLQRVGKINPQAYQKAQELLGVWSRQVADDVMEVAVKGINDVQAGRLPIDEFFGEIEYMLHNRGIASRTQEATKILAEAQQYAQAGNWTRWRDILKDYVQRSAIAKEYSLEFGPVLSNYMHSVVKPYVWNVLPLEEGLHGLSITDGRPLSTKLSLGRAIQTETAQLSKEHRLWMNSDYIPIMKGEMTDSQLRGLLRWSNIKSKMLDWIDDTPFVQKAMGKKLTQKVKGMLLNDRGPLGYMNAHGRVAGYFYLSALGANPASAFQNLLQPIITTGPLVGTKATLKGMSTTVSKLGKYVNFRAAGLNGHEALLKAFPEFAETALTPTPLSDMVLKEALDEMWTGASKLGLQGLKPGTRPWIEKMKTGMMTLFSKSEMWNRLMTFEAGYAKATADGLKGAAAIQAGADVVRMTQFPAGVGQMPRALLKIPPAWRQFMYFPIRYASFLAESTLAGGGATRNWGTILRTIGASAATAKFASNALGVDVGRSLMLGAMPLPSYEDSPFFPLPVVPPAISLAGGTAASLATGDSKYISRQAGLLFPGGVALRRAYKALSPKYARYKERTPDGRIPVYNAKQALIGYQTPRELALRAIGIQPSNVRAEQELSRYLMSQRDTIRDMRRAYVEAIVKGRTGEAQRINSAFQRQFPMLGPLQVQQSDIQAAQDRRSYSRLQRLLRTMPQSYRENFQSVMAAAMSSQFMNSFSNPEPPSVLQNFNPPPQTPSRQLGVPASPHLSTQGGGFRSGGVGGSTFSMQPPAPVFETGSF